MYTPQEAADLIVNANEAFDSDCDESEDSGDGFSDNEVGNPDFIYSDSSDTASESSPYKADSESFLSKDGYYKYTDEPPTNRRRISQVNIFKATPGIPH